MYFSSEELETTGLLRTEDVEGDYNPVLFKYPKVFYRACEFYIKKNVLEPNKFLERDVKDWYITLVPIHNDPDNVKIEFDSRCGLVSSLSYRVVCITVKLTNSYTLVHDLKSQQTFTFKSVEIFKDRGYEDEDEPSYPSHYEHVRKLKEAGQGVTIDHFFLFWHNKLFHYNWAKSKSSNLIFKCTKAILENNKGAKQQEVQQWVTNRIVEGFESGRYNAQGTLDYQVISEHVQMWRCRNVLDHMGK
jgi:hypothetical protein